jgi:hypothetical protein
MRVLVLKGESQYGGTRLFADEAAAAFGRRGDEVLLLDLGAGVTLEADLVAASAGGAFDLVLSFNILGSYRTSGGQTLGELFGCPHVVWHTDYILSSWDRLPSTPPTTVILVVDPTQVDALSATAGPDRFYARFFPHPAVGSAIPDEPDVEAFLTARPTPLLWSGGFVKPRRLWSSAAPATQRIMDAAVELALSVEWMPPHEAFMRTLVSVGLDPTEPQLRANLASAWMIDAEVRERRRHSFLLALAKEGFDLHICGAGWEPHLYRFKNATYHGEVPMTRMVDLMRQTRVVLNTNGNFGAGSHERPFSASLAGAATFSDISRYYLEEFTPGENIELFSWLDLPGAMAQLQALISDPERCRRYARSAKALTLARHTWDAQIPALLDAVSSRGK